MSKKRDFVRLTIGSTRSTPPASAYTKKTLTMRNAKYTVRMRSSRLPMFQWHSALARLVMMTLVVWNLSALIGMGGWWGWKIGVMMMVL